LGAHAADQHVVPLCRGHHREYHQIGRDTFAEKYRVDLPALANALAALHKTHP
jgi:hypothetical protein